MRFFSRVIRLSLGLVSLLVIAIAAAWLTARPVAPDAIYDHPRPLESEAGTLLKSEPFAAAVPEGARAWRILYVTSTVQTRASNQLRARSPWGDCRFGAVQ